jgi:hypothetical protein
MTAIDRTAVEADLAELLPLLTDEELEALVSAARSTFEWRHRQQARWEALKVEKRVARTLRKGRKAL